jgi:hypothetical protein
MKRVDCLECEHFIDPIQQDPYNLLSKVIRKPACDLGKRVMFRQPRNYFESGGFFRYCNEFKNKVIKNEKTY